MTEPTINSLERPMLRSEITELGDFNLKENYFTVGVAFVDDDGGIEIPSEIGHVAMFTSEFQDDGSPVDSDPIGMVSCDHTLGDINEPMQVG